MSDARPTDPIRRLWSSSRPRTRPELAGLPPPGDRAAVLRPVLLNAYGREGLADRRWRDITIALPEPARGAYRLVVVEMPIGTIRLWTVEEVARDEAVGFVRGRARHLVETADFGAERVRLAALDAEGLDVIARLSDQLRDAHRWALTVEPDATLDPTWSSSRRSRWTRATLAENQADRAGTRALIAVHQVVGVAERLSP